MERFGSLPQQPAPRLSADPVYNPLADLSAALPDRANYIARHWRGDFSLPISYWVNGWLLGLGYIAGTIPVIDYPSSSVTYLIGLVVLIALGFAMQVWQLIGLWRSARKHKERGGRRIWAYLAQVSVVFGWLSFARGIFEALGLHPGK